MNGFIHGVTRAIAETFAFPDPILEIGSHQIAGQESIAELRPFFKARSYVGLDTRPGPGVDMVGDVQALPQANASIGTVLALNTFEHVPQFWRGFEEIYRVLRPDGALIVSIPFYFHIHCYPSDYWRFTPEGLNLLLDKYPHRILGWHGPRKRPANLWAVAFREEHEPITQTQIETYRAFLGRYGRQPLRWSKKLRYRVGRLLCGSRPFAPYLDQERWETECRTPVLS